MAKQVGLLIKGRIDEYSFYHDRLHGYLVRRTGGVTSKQYKSDQRYAAARDASSEFAAVSKAGKLIRDAFAPFINQVKDGTMVNRMNKELVALKQLDNKHLRGERRPETMLTDTDANKLLRIFQFNEQVKVYELFEGFPTVNMSGTSLSLTPAKGRDKVNRVSTAFPEGATHAGLTLVRSVIDFEKGCFETRASRMEVVSKVGSATGVPELLYAIPKGRDEVNRVPTKGIEIVCLQVIFYEEVNGELVELKEKVHGMGIIGITDAQLQIVNERINKRSVKSHRFRRSGVVGNCGLIPDCLPEDIRLRQNLRRRGYLRFECKYEVAREYYVVQKKGVKT